VCKAGPVDQKAAAVLISAGFAGEIVIFNDSR
jgi:hypothetical protein